MICLSIVLRLFIHKQQVKAQSQDSCTSIITDSEITANNCFQFWLSGPSLCAIVDFLVLEVFNSNNLLSEAVASLKLFYPKRIRKQFCAFLKAPNFI